MSTKENTAGNHKLVATTLNQSYSCEAVNQRALELSPSMIN